jgi:hypothetical protein
MGTPPPMNPPAGIIRKQISLNQKFLTRAWGLFFGHESPTSSTSLQDLNLPRICRHACRHHPRLFDRLRRPSDGSAAPSPRAAKLGRGGCGAEWARCHPEIHHGTGWSPYTRRSFRGNSDEPNLPIKSKRKPALQITHQIKH